MQSHSHAPPPDGLLGRVGVACRTCHDDLGGGGQGAKPRKGFKPAAVGQAGGEVDDVRLRGCQKSFRQRGCVTRGVAESGGEVGHQLGERRVAVYDQHVGHAFSVVPCQARM